MASQSGTDGKGLGISTTSPARSSRDLRQPGLESDARAWVWLSQAASATGVVATKIDKLSRAERQRAMKTYEAVFEHPVLPFSADTGEGLDDLWKLIDRLLNNNNLRAGSKRR